MNTKKIARTGLMLAVTLVFQIGFRQFAQPLVGPLVNMMLILTTLTVGLASGIFVGTLTPIIALIIGILPIIPMIPMIIIANVVYVCVFFVINNRFKKRAISILSVIVASCIKFGLLYGSVRLILPLFIETVKPPIIAAFSLPQLYTALIGGFIAIIIYEFIKKRIDQ